MSGFIQKYIEHTREYESPRAFWEWSALATISAVLRDSVWVMEGDSEIFPNIYVLFLAGPAARKNRPVVMSEKLLRKVGNTKIISGRSSIQAILDELARTETAANTGKMTFKPGTAIFYAPELAGAIVQSEDAVNILTDIYDGKTEFANRLRHSAHFKIDRIVFSALMASNEAMLRGVFDGRAIHGGLLSRTCLVVPDEFRPGNPLTDEEQPEIEEARRQRFDNLILLLKQISLLRGKLRFHKEAADFHSSWYLKFREEYLRRGDASGVMGRIHTMIKKVAIIYAAAEGEMEISRFHMEQATTQCLSLLPNYGSFLMSSGKSTIAEACAIVINALFNAPLYTLDRKAILSEHWQNIDASTLDSVITTLESGGIITAYQNGNMFGYRLTDKTVQKMKGEI